MNNRLEELRSELEKVLGFECVLVKLETYNNDVDEYLSLKAKLEQAGKALQYYDTLYANIDSNIQHGELITDWLKRQGETARTALKSIKGEG